jgi:hypothetical protein
MTEHFNSETSKNFLESSSDFITEGDTVQHKKLVDFKGQVRRIYDANDEYGKSRKVAELFTADGKIFSAPLGEFVLKEKRK